jgi:hypothetical protein
VAYENQERVKMMPHRKMKKNEKKEKRCPGWD